MLRFLVQSWLVLTVAALVVLTAVIAAQALLDVVRRLKALVRRARPEVRGRLLLRTARHRPATSRAGR